MWEDNRNGLFHWRKHYYGLWNILAWRDSLKLQCLNGFVFYKHTAFGFTRHKLPWCPVKQKAWWTGVVWIIVTFSSAVWTLILTAPIHCKSGEETNSSTSWKAWGWANVHQMFIFGWEPLVYQLVTSNYISPVLFPSLRCKDSQLPLGGQVCHLF